MAEQAVTGELLSAKNKEIYRENSVDGLFLPTKFA